MGTKWSEQDHLWEYEKQGLVEKTMHGSEANPIYSKFQTNPETKATKLFGVKCDEGWRTSIVCTGMYEHVADWLVKELQGKPFAKSPYEEGVI